jgi:hypothetical protein
MRPAGGGCVISWRVDDVQVAGPRDTTRSVSFAGATLSDQRFELVASHSGYSSEAAGRAGSLRGHRGIFMIDAAQEWRRHATQLALAGFDVSDAGGPRPALTVDNAAAALESAQISSLSGVVETVALAYAEGRVNPLPLVIGTLFVVDNVSTALVNAAGAGVLAVNWATGADSEMASAIGQSMLNYPGVIGGAVRGIATAIGGETAGEVAGLAYATATVFTPAGATSAINRSFTTAALQHALLRGGTAGGQLGNIMIDLGVQAQTVRPWLSQTQLGATYLDQIVQWMTRGSGNANQTALDLAAQQAGSRVSPTPTARTNMADLELADFLRQIADPRSPFNESTSGDFSQSTAGLSDVVIAGVLAFRLFDHAIQDGDQVALNVTGDGRTVLSSTVTLTNSGQFFSTAVASGQAVITVTALNLGDLVPNTGAVSVTSPIVSGNGTQTYNLQVGQTGTMRVLVLGRRARNQ